MNSEEQGDDGLDLYDDILVEDLTCQQESLHEVQIKYQEALRKIASLEDTNRQNETDIDNLKKKNAYLMKNISVLYKTACTELERKKELIESLRSNTAPGKDHNSAPRNSIPDHSHLNMFDPKNNENHRFNEGGFDPYYNPGWGDRDTDMHFRVSPNFYSPHDSYSPKDGRDGTPDKMLPYSFSNAHRRDRPDKPTSSSKPHKSLTRKSPLEDNYTPPTLDKDSRSSHERRTDEYTPHTKQTDSSTSLNKHSNSRSKHPESKLSHSKPTRSKSPTSSLNDKRLSSSKRSHSDSRKHSSHHPESRSSDHRSSQSKLSESKKSSLSSRNDKSKNHEPSSSSSSKSRQKQSHSVDRGDSKSTSGSRRSGSSDKDPKSDRRKDPKSDKRKDPKSEKRKTKTSESRSSEDKKSVTSKRKLPKEFSSSCESKSKRKPKEKSKMPERRTSRSSETERHLKSASETEEENLGKNSKYQKQSLGETGSQVNLKKNKKEDSKLHDLKNNDIHESPVLTSEELSQESDEEDTLVEISCSPNKDRPDDTASEAATESQSLKSVSTVDSTITTKNSSSSTSLVSSHKTDLADTESDAEKVPDSDVVSIEADSEKDCESDIDVLESGNEADAAKDPKSDNPDIEGDAEKDLEKCEELEIEISDPCSSILWAGKTPSDSDENSRGVEDEATSDAMTSSKKDEQSGQSSETSDNFSPEKPSIVIKCFAGDHGDRSPIIIPCYPSKKKTACSSPSESDEECETESNVTSTPSKNLIARSLFPINPPKCDLGNVHSKPEVLTKQKQISCQVGNKHLGMANSKDSSRQNKSSVSSASKTSKKSTKQELNNDLDFICSPILGKESDLSTTTNGINTNICQNEVTERTSSSKEDNLSDGSSDKNNENQIAGVSDKNDPSSDGELEEGELLTDEENESDVAATIKTKTWSPVSFKSKTPQKCKKASDKRYRDSRKSPRREPMKSNPDNLQRSVRDRLGSKPSRHRDDKNKSATSSRSGSKSQLKRRDEKQRHSGARHADKSKADRKQRTR